MVPYRSGRRLPAVVWRDAYANGMDEDDDYFMRPGGLRHWLTIHLRVWLPVGRRIPLKYLITQARVELDSTMPAIRDTPPADTPWEALQALAGISAGRYNPYVPAPGDLGWLLAIATGQPAPTPWRSRRWSDIDPVKGEDRREPLELIAPFGYYQPHGRRERWEAMAGYGLNAIRRPLAYRWALWRLSRMFDIPRPKRARLHRTPHTPRWL